MTKKQWLIFWLFALALLFIVCIFSHKDQMATKQPQPAVKPAISKAEVKPLPVKPKEFKDITLKITKDADSYLMSGVLNNKNELANLEEKFQGATTNDLKFNEDVKNTKALSTIMSLKDTISKFKKGYIEYADKELIVDGIVGSDEEKNLIDSTLASIKDIKVNSNIAVEKPKPAVEHLSKLSIVKADDGVTISGTFSSEAELESLIKSFQDKGIKTNKGLCIIDSDLKADGWKSPVSSVMDDFIKFDVGAIQFDKNSFSIEGKTTNKDIKGSVHSSLANITDGIEVSEDVKYIEPTPTKEQIQEKINSILKLKHVRFVTNTATLINESKPVLDEVVEVILTMPALKIEINGYTDSDGKETDNLILSQKRADSVKSYLVDHGVKSENLKAKGFGEANPIVENNSPENKQLNRRVEFKIIGE